MYAAGQVSSPGSTTKEQRWYDTSTRSHREAGEKAALDQLVWVMAHDLTVFAGAGLALIGIDDQV